MFGFELFDNEERDEVTDKNARKAPDGVYAETVDVAGLFIKYTEVDSSSKPPAPMRIKNPYLVIQRPRLAVVTNLLGSLFKLAVPRVR